MSARDGSLNEISLAIGGLQANMSGVGKQLEAINAKLDQLVDIPDRIKDCEEGVKDYRKTKVIGLGIVSALGFGGGTGSHFLTKWLSGGS